MNKRNVGDRVQFEALPGLWVERDEKNGTYTVYNKGCRWLGRCTARGNMEMNSPGRTEDVINAVKVFRGVREAL